MKIYKLLFLTALSCFTLSCSQDSVDENSIDDSNNRLAASQFDDSYLGVYKGLFTTNDGLTRGSINLTLSPNNIGIAQITLSSGEVIELQSRNPKLTVDNKVSELVFSSAGLSNIDVSLRFSVDANGLNPQVSTVSFDNKDSDILIAKNLSRVPLTPITGTYDCTDCASQGVAFPNNRTWNVMSIGAGNNQNFMIQVVFDRRVYTSAAQNNTQNGCFDFMGYTICNILGSARVLGRDLTFSGTHIYDASSTLACSEVNGNWSVPSYGISGTFQSDSNCSESILRLTCGETLVDNGGAADYSNNSSDTYRIDAGAGNVVELPFTEFNLENGWDFMRIYDGASTSAPEITDVNGQLIGDFGSRGSGFTGTGTGVNSLEGQTVVSSGQYLTVVFESDGSVTGPGYNALVGCVTARMGYSSNIKTSDTFRPSLSVLIPKGTE